MREPYHPRPHCWRCGEECVVSPSTDLQPPQHHQQAPLQHHQLVQAQFNNKLHIKNELHRFKSI